MSDELSNEQIEEISSHLAARKKIEAIKVYRAATGKGLKEAKDFIDALVPKLKEQDPEKFGHLGASGSGCASVVLLCLGLAASACVTAVVISW